MRNHRSMFPLLSIGALALAMAFSAHADSNAYSAMLQNNAMRQANLTQQMINLGGAPVGSRGGAAGPAPCLPPFELQRLRLHRSPARRSPRPTSCRRGRAIRSSTRRSPA